MQKVVEKRHIIAVSYTHLDVYKRQVDAVGRVYEWLNDLITRAQHATDATYHDKEAWSWDKKSPLRDAGTKYDVGNIYQYYHASLAALMAGGGWNTAASAGARCVACDIYPVSYTHLGEVSKRYCRDL